MTGARRVWKCVTHEGCDFTVEWQTPRMTPSQLAMISEHRRGAAVRTPPASSPTFEVTANEAAGSAEVNTPPEEAPLADETALELIDQKIQAALDGVSQSIVEQVRGSLGPIGTAMTTLSGRLAELEKRVNQAQDRPAPIDYHANGQNGRHPEQPIEVEYDQPAYEAARSQTGGVAGIIEQVAPLLKALGILGAAPAAPAAADPIANIRHALNTVAELVNVVNGLQLSTSEVRLSYQRELTEAIKTAQMAGADPERVVDTLHERAESGLAEIRGRRAPQAQPSAAEAQEGST